MAPGRWDVARVREEFPALSQTDMGMPRLYADASAGTQIPGRVIERMVAAMVNGCANDGGEFTTSRLAEETMFEAHRAAAGFLGASSWEEIIFGLNSTSLLFGFSRMLARGWQPGDNILLTRMDHDANVAPWLIAAKETGVAVRWLPFDKDSCEYRLDELSSLIDRRTRLVACNHVSNLFGVINDIAPIVAAAKAVGAISVVDGVQAAPHIPLDVKELECDIYAVSAYKFFGPHAAILYVRQSVLDQLSPLKVRPSPDRMPWRFSPGTPSFEAQAGTAAAIDYFAWLGVEFGSAAEEAPLRARSSQGIGCALAYERALTNRFLSGAESISGLRIVGPGSAAGHRQIPTISFALEGVAPADLASRAAKENIFLWHGNFYAYEPVRYLGLDPDVGVNRVGFAHYNTLEEVDHILEMLSHWASSTAAKRGPGRTVATLEA